MRKVRPAHPGFHLAALAGVGVVTLVALSGCPAYPAALCSFGECEPVDAGPSGPGTLGSPGSPGGGEGGRPFDGGTGVVVPPGCTKTPKEDGTQVRDECGIFVAPTGSDGAVGTKSAPARTVARGLTLARAAGKRLFLCASTYDEKLVVDATRDGIAVHGGLGCPGADGGTAAGWAYTGESARLAPATAGVGVSVQGLALGLLLEDVEVRAKDAVAAGESSVAMFVSGSNGVVLKRVRLLAGAGVAGSAGVTPTGLVPEPLPLGGGTKAGKGATNNNGGEDQSCTCGTATTVGGRGANATSAAPSEPGVSGRVGASTTPYPPSPSPTHTGAGGEAYTSVNGACGNGRRGAQPPDGPVGAGGQASWSLSASGLSSTGAGAAGAAGQIGQGGGGGGSTIEAAAQAGGGGGGGCGGCGGAPGTGGQAGGSSVALVALNASLEIAESTLVAGAAGSGGVGGAGQVGSVGGAQGPSATGCPGGPGGNGGKGGAGGGGVGGASLAILHKGPAPVTDAKTTLTAGALGAGGADGTGATTGAGAGKPGLAQGVLAVP